ncbi:MAG: prepilin-type N-terminal cleavage/methylation domain-containing protein [Acidimicrobiia bacterium]|nr:prepilin-type N-terminal cleavage/methylation domain-containing protein [Acidimicrobiia bacterium]
MRKRLSKDEGFTLIELMVVVLIIAVLVAIAIPSFIGFRNNAQDRDAQSAVRNTLLAEKGYFTETGSFTTDGANLQSYANVTLSTTLNEDDVQVLAGADSICLLQASESGKIFAVWEGKTEGTVYGQFANTAAAPTTCADDGSAPAWSGW